MTSSKYQQADVRRAAAMARLSARCQCTQDWHEHLPGQCTAVPAVFDLSEAIGLDGVGTAEPVNDNGTLMGIN